MIPSRYVRFVWALAAFVPGVSADPPYWDWSPTPPMGWNSYDAWGSSVTEDQVLENARFLQEHLLAHGWRYVVVDFRWYDAVSSYDDRDLARDRTGARLCSECLPTWRPGRGMIRARDCRRGGVSTL